MADTFSMSMIFQMFSDDFDINKFPLPEEKPYDFLEYIRLPIRIIKEGVSNVIKGRDFNSLTN
jgi:hypothetical protein